MHVLCFHSMITLNFSSSICFRFFSTFTLCICVSAPRQSDAYHVLPPPPFSNAPMCLCEESEIQTLCSTYVLFMAASYRRLRMHTQNDLFGPPLSLLSPRQWMAMNRRVRVKFHRWRLQSLTCIVTLQSRIKHNSAWRYWVYNMFKNNVKFIFITVYDMNYAVFLREIVADANTCGWMHLHVKCHVYVLTDIEILMTSNSSHKCGVFLPYGPQNCS